MSGGHETFAHVRTLPEPVSWPFEPGRCLRGSHSPSSRPCGARCFPGSYRSWHGHLARTARGLRSVLSLLVSGFHIPFTALTRRTSVCHDIQQHGVEIENIFEEET